MNTEHRWNPEMGDVDWDICNSWFMPALTGLPELEHALCAFDNEHIVAPGGYLNGNELYAAPAAQGRFRARPGSVHTFLPYIHS